MRDDSERAMAERLRLAFDMFETGVAMMRQKLRREHPAESEAQIDERLGRWLMDRPGAEFGDGVGRGFEGTWPREST